MLALVLSMHMAALSISSPPEQPEDRFVRDVVVGAIVMAAGTSSLMVATGLSTNNDDLMFAAPSIAPFAAIAGAMIGAVIGHFDADALRAERAEQKRRHERTNATRRADDGVVVDVE